jgi:hypothetical protein
MQYQSYILRIYLGPTPFQSLSLLTTVNWGATLTGAEKYFRQFFQNTPKFSKFRMVIQAGLWPFFSEDSDKGDYDVS